MKEETIRELLLNIKEDKVSIDKAVQTLKALPFEDLGYAKIDNHRELRNGFPEVIYCEGKSPEQIIGIAKKMSEHGSNVLATRIDKNTYDKIKADLPESEYFSEARIFFIKNQEISQSKSKVLVLAAGTSDIRVAEEAAITCEKFGLNIERIYDVGVAGLHRLLDKKEKLFNAQVIIAVAGMEGALPSVVGGLVSCPVIAVPTSIGYGTQFSGLTPLLAMLNSCASGIGVVNIDNGFGAGYLASSIIKQIDKANF